MLPFNFIFMLTQNDKTVPDAAHHLQTVLAAGIRHIGFKDIGLPFSDLKQLNQTIQSNGASSYLEVVSQDRDSELASAKAAVELGVDYLLGGTHVQEVLPLLQGSNIRYYPFPGQVHGHPSILGGTLAEIVESARSISNQAGVHGLDLLAYRASHAHVPDLIKAVCAYVNKPVIIAGSVDTPEQIQLIQEAGASGFTVGTAALEGRFPANGTGLSEQLSAIQQAYASFQ